MKKKAFKKTLISIGLVLLSFMTTSGQVVFIDDATHWVLRDAPEKTGELLVDFWSEK
jgi:pimeloyl-ACP methyl ester carboxylesterase